MKCLIHFLNNWSVVAKKIFISYFQGVADIFTRVVTAIETDDDQPTKDKEKCVISWSNILPEDIVVRTHKDKRTTFYKNCCKSHACIFDW